MRRFFREIEEMVRQVVVVVTIWHCCFTRYVLIHFFQQQYNRVHTTYNTGGGKEPFLVSLSSLQHQRDNIGVKYFLEQNFYFLLCYCFPQFSKIGDLAFLCLANMFLWAGRIMLRVEKLRGFLFPEKPTIVVETQCFMEVYSVFQL